MALSSSLVAEASAPPVLAASQGPVVAIIGGTGKTGKWALKGALQRGYTVRLLARSPDKAKTVIEGLFGAGAKQVEQVTVVQGSATSAAALAELLAGCDAVLSFLGMVDGKTWIVSPGVQAILAALQKMDAPPKFVSLSAMGIGDSANQMRKSSCCIGRLTMCCVIPRLLKNCFADMADAEEHMANARPGLRTTTIRAPILADNKKLEHNYAVKEQTAFRYAAADETTGIRSSFLDRQYVACALLDCVEASECDGKTLTVLKA